MGHRGDARPGILASRPAPIQVSYLGHPGTMGADFIDYIIADSIVVPPGEEAFYAEKVVRLPDCFQVNDAKRVIAEATPTRKQAGLPEKGFVFASFNGGNISAPVFDAWMGLLTRIEGSVLWLSEVSDGTKFNLHQHAAARGADPARLIFAPRIGEAEHLARHRLPDLFLDTHPCSTQTAASDALWAGLPVLTCRGNTFAGRVAASQLQSLGLTELVTSTLAEYTALALWLAEDPDILAEIRKRLAENRSTRPLFDTDLTRRHLEEAYTVMWAHHQAGERPASFDVEARPEPPPPPPPPPPAAPETVAVPADAAVSGTTDAVPASPADAPAAPPAAAPATQPLDDAAAPPADAATTTTAEPPPPVGQS
jgi:predicted O-linked N-acetylglucosamine transferase (SPINDLY family)